MIAFSDNAGATEKNECIQKLNEPVSFLLLNDGEEIEIVLGTGENRQKVSSENRHF